MAQENLLIKCQHKIGCFKYIIIERNDNGEQIPLQVYLEEVQANAIPYNDDTIEVSTKYKVRYRGKTKWVKENEIYDNKEEAIKYIKQQ